MTTLTPTDLETICDVVSNHYGIAHVDLYTVTRAARISQPRQLCFYLLRKLTGADLVNIAVAFDMHHASVVHGVKTTMDVMSVDRKFAATVEALEQRCKVMLEGDKE